VKLPLPFPNPAPLSLNLREFEPIQRRGQSFRHAPSSHVFRELTSSCCRGFSRSRLLGGFDAIRKRHYLHVHRCWPPVQTRWRERQRETERETDTERETRTHHIL